MSLEAGLLLAAAMLLGNAFFVGAEFGLVSARRSNIELEALGGSRSAKMTLSAMEQVSLMLAGAQLGVTACSLILGAVSEPIISRLLETPLQAVGLPNGLLYPFSLLFALIITVYLHVVIGEMVPKNLALASPTRTALLLTPPLLFFVRIAGPIVKALNFTANRCLRLTGVTPKQEINSTFSRDEVAGFVKESHKKGLISHDEQHLLYGALSFDEQTIQSVILPLEQIVYVSNQATPRDIEQKSSQTGFSRFVVRDSRGAYTGYVHLKDVIGLSEAEYRKPIRPHSIRPLASLKKHTYLREALIDMQQTGAHLAKVISGKNTVVGIVALEDVLEELVGTIRDDTQKIQNILS